MNFGSDTALILAVQMVTIGILIQNITTFMFIIAGIGLFFFVIKEQHKRDKQVQEKIQEWKKKNEH